MVRKMPILHHRQAGCGQRFKTDLGLGPKPGPGQDWNRPFHRQLPNGDKPLLPTVGPMGGAAAACTAVWIKEPMIVSVTHLTPVKCKGPRLFDNLLQKSWRYVALSKS
jgi:hypothetical protein